MGPPGPPYHATAPTKLGDIVVYRALRLYERPWELRKVDIPQVMSDQELRALLLPAVAFGNSAGKESPFLHCTMTVVKALAIMSERRQLYSNWLVRWPIDAAAHIKLSHLAAQRKYLFEDPNDSEFLASCLGEVRAYSLKDKEVVVTENPPEESVQWWDEQDRKWRSVAEARAWYDARVGRRSVPLFAATSQQQGAASSSAAGQHVVPGPSGGMEGGEGGDGG